MNDNEENKENVEGQEKSSSSGNKPKSEGYGIASLICGILSFVIPVLGLILAILAIVFYFKQKKSGTTTISIVGLVFGIIGIFVSLLVTMVVGLVAFQAWFISYQSDISAQVEEEAQAGVDITVERIDDNGIYLNSSALNDEDIEVTNVIIEGNSCDISGFISPGDLENFELEGGCAEGLKFGEPYSVVVETDNGIFESTQVMR